MNRSILHSLRLAPWMVAVIVALAAGGCSGESIQRAPEDVGEICVPLDENDPSFVGFDIGVAYIESGSPVCSTGICLVNHFQGRVSCPSGQPPPLACDPTVPCPLGECIESTALATQCETDASCPTEFFCDAGSGTCKRFVCDERPGSDMCWTPGGVPVGYAVCGQCGSRLPSQAVYCSCRCGPAEGAPADPDFPFCECPRGFVCSEIRQNIGLGAEHLTGKYCVKEGTQYTSPESCGSVAGYFDSSECAGSGL